MDIHSMRDDWSPALARGRTALETAHTEIAAVAAGIENAPVDPAAKDAVRELAGVLASLTERIDHVNAITRQADEQFWTQLAEGGRPNPQAWGA